jgi:putative hydroxymethylpyrimidine transport system permease protein
MKNQMFRLPVLAVGLLLAWHAGVVLSGVPKYILPGPLPVAEALVTHFPSLIRHTGVTVLEIILGLGIGTVLGILCALTMTISRTARHWLLPVLVISQAVPVFALAPILVLWLGYGIWSKVTMAVLIIFFPITSAFYDGLRTTNPDWIELARVMNGSRAAMLRHIRIPAALPGLASGLRVAAVVAPIGAVIGEWVGASRGLGFAMLHSNARMQIDIMFAALVLLAVAALSLYFLMDFLMARLVFWHNTEHEE